jgi:eukaryotic-like serine/threonine-protein kinase
VPRFFKGMGPSEEERARIDLPPAPAVEEAPAPPLPPPPPEPAPPPSRRLRTFGWFLAGIAVMAGGGYLVAALVLFPSPLLPNERQVPRVLTLSEEEARHDIERAGLAPTVVGREPHPTARRGDVIWQDPPPGVAAPRGSAVQLVLAAGPPRVAVPDVHGYDEAFARRMLAAVGLTVELVDTVLIKDIQTGTVAGTEPAAGESLAVGRSVTLHLAR